MAPTHDPRLAEIYAHPVGRDAIDKVLLQLGRSRAWVDNPVVGRLPLSVMVRLAKGILGPDFGTALLAVLADHPVPEPSVTPRSDTGAWWRDAIFYQVYPRSFADSDGDGIGDLRGIIGRLDYLAELGVDCLWLSPIFDSPNEDMGYDIRDYRAVMAEMGTLADLDALIAGCHERGMRIILDLVVNHTSAEHPWFQAAIAEPDGPYGDYYFLRAGSPDRPPNNWTSFFGGPAWRWIPAAQRWALRLFAPGQPDLNWENPAVRAEVAEIVRFWRARGVDGFRLDVINYISKRSGLPDGNPALGELIGFPGIEHYFFGPRLREFLRGLRREGFTRRDDDPPPSSTVRVRRPDGSVGEPLPQDLQGIMVGETPGVGIELGKLLTDPADPALDLTFNFDILEPPGKVRWDDYRYDLAYLKRYYIDYLGRIGPHARIALFVENHDNPRVVSKVLGPDDRDPVRRAAVAKAIAVIELMLPGVPFLFQGQEIAAINQAFTGAGELRDVESLNRFAELRGDGTGEGEAFAAVLAGARDHARVPMRWAPGGGFTTGTPWQPGREASVGFSVVEQDVDPGSVLNFYRELIALRRAHPALTSDGVEFLAPRSTRYFGWIRGTDDDRWLIEVNLTAAAIRRPRGLPDAVVEAGTVDHRQPVMAPYEAVVSRVIGDDDRDG